MANGKYHQFIRTMEFYNTMLPCNSSAILQKHSNRTVTSSNMAVEENFDHLKARKFERLDWI